MKKRIDYPSFEAYEHGEDVRNEFVYVVHDNGWLLCDLTTCCKRPQTAVKRLFDQLHEEIFDGWYGDISESVRGGYFESTDAKLADGSLNPYRLFAWGLEEVDDGIWYIFLNVRENRIIWEDEMISSAELIKRLTDENGDLDSDSLDALMTDQDALSMAKKSFHGSYTPAKLIARYIAQTGYQTIVAR